MHIAFVSQPRDSVVVRGPQTSSVAIVLWELARQLAASNRVTVVAPQRGGQPLRETSDAGIRIVRVPGVRRNLNRGAEFLQALLGRGQPHFAGSSYFAEYGRAAAEILAGDPPDVVHLMVHPQFALPIRSAVGDAGLVLHLHDALQARLDPTVASARLGQFDAILGVSDWVSSEIRQRYPEHSSMVRTLHNGVNPEQFVPIARPPDSMPGRRILYVGRVSPEKGAAQLTAAFVELAADRPDIHLDLVGSISMLPYSIIRLLEQDPAVSTLGQYYGDTLVSKFRKQILGARSSFRRVLEDGIPADFADRVHFRGPLPHDNLAELYGRADVFAFPSIWEEPFGLPVLEAMAMELPVVASRSGGIPEIVRDSETGLLFERGDGPGLAAALTQLLDDPEARTRLGAAGRVRARELFSWRDAGRRLADFYEELR